MDSGLPLRGSRNDSVIEEFSKCRMLGGSRLNNACHKKQR
jgi:hypothetical protein